MRKLFFLLLSIGIFFTSSACTTFFLHKNGQMVFGRNYDWVSGSGMVCVNQSGLTKTSSKTSDGETISWVSAYGSITFNQYGKEFPTGGMNEKGLVVELMWLDGTQYPYADSRPALGVLQWIQYQLDNSKTIDDVIASDKIIRIASKGTTPLHYLIADGNGNVATIEFLNGKLTIHRGKDLPFPVLTNNRYDESIQASGIALASSGGNSISFQDNSIERFAKACTMVKDFQQNDIKTSVIDYSFSILDKVAQGSHTKWSIVYDIANKKVHFKTLGYPELKQVTFSSFDFKCSSISKAWDMNQHAKGEVSNLFQDFNLELNSRIVETSFTESRNQISVNDETKKKAWEYAFSVRCEN